MRTQLLFCDRIAWWILHVQYELETVLAVLVGRICQKAAPHPVFATRDTQRKRFLNLFKNNVVTHSEVTWLQSAPKVQSSNNYNSTETSRVFTYAIGNYWGIVQVNWVWRALCFCDQRQKPHLSCNRDRRCVFLPEYISLLFDEADWAATAKRATRTIDRFTAILSTYFHSVS